MKRNDLFEGCYAKLTNGSEVGPISRLGFGNACDWYFYLANEDLVLRWDNRGVCQQSAAYDIVAVRGMCQDEILNRDIRASLSEPSKKAGSAVDTATDRPITLKDLQEAVKQIITSAAPVNAVPKISVGFSDRDKKALDDILKTIAKITNARTYGQFGGLVSPAKTPDESESKLPSSENDQGGQSDFEAYRDRAKAALKVWLYGDDTHAGYLRSWLDKRGLSKFTDITEEAVLTALLTELVGWRRVKTPVHEPAIGLQFWFDNKLYRVEAGAYAGTALCSIVKRRDESASTSSASEKPLGGQSDTIAISVEEFVQLAGKANRHAGSPFGYNSIMVEELNKLISQKTAQRAC